jgi:hypothetical protein
MNFRLQLQRPSAEAVGKGRCELRSNERCARITRCRLWNRYRRWQMPRGDRCSDFLTAFDAWRAGPHGEDLRIRGPSDPRSEGNVTQFRPVLHSGQSLVSNRANVREFHFHGVSGRKIGMVEVLWPQILKTA